MRTPGASKTAYEAWHEGRRRLPRLCAPGHHLLPLPEHSRALLHRVPGRHRRAGRARADGLCGWFEAWLDGRWYTFDARNNAPRIGRILMARGRDACDVALASTFGPNILQRFTVRTDEFRPA
jgi:hypothetical protein